MDNLIIADFADGKGIKITCPEDHYLTRFNDGDDILTFYATKIVYAPKDIDPTIYHCITDEEYEAYMTQKTEAEIESISGDTIEEVVEDEVISGDTTDDEVISGDTFTVEEE